MRNETGLPQAEQGVAATPNTLIGGYRQEAEPPPEGQFHIGLVLSGAVSAGAYTAGVIDFLVQALDAWEQVKRDQEEANPDAQTWQVPWHRVKVRIITGASAGSITAAIAAPALHYHFPHVSAAQLAKGAGFDPGMNPLWRVGQGHRRQQASQ
jgi:predicted acylesterase/phospholipase RssA